MILIAGITIVLKRKFSASQFWDDCRRYDITVMQYIGETLRYLCNTPKVRGSPVALQLRWAAAEHLCVRLALGRKTTRRTTKCELPSATVSDLTFGLSFLIALGTLKLESCTLPQRETSASSTTRPRSGQWDESTWCTR